MYKHGIILTILTTLCACAAVRADSRHQKHPQPRNLSAPWTDPGVDIGAVNRATVLFATPSADSPGLGALNPEDWTVLVSRHQNNGWFNVIGLSSGRQGWVRASRLTVHYTHHPNPGIVLGASHGNGSDPPSMAVSNDSNRDVYLHIENLPEMRIKPHGEQDVTLLPGVVRFNASFPGLIPLFGYKAFVNGDTYTWHFSIVPTNGAHSHQTVSPSLRATVQQLQSEVNVREAELKVFKSLVDNERTTLTTQEAQAQTDGAAIEAARKALNHEDQLALDSFNKQVDATNAEMDACRQAEQKFNSDVAAYNLKLKEKGALYNRLEAITATINTAH